MGAVIDGGLLMRMRDRSVTDRMAVSVNLNRLLNRTMIMRTMVIRTMVMGTIVVMMRH